MLPVAGDLEVEGLLQLARVALLIRSGQHQHCLGPEVVLLRSGDAEFSVLQDR